MWPHLVVLVKPARYLVQLLPYSREVEVLQLGEKWIGGCRQVMFALLLLREGVCGGHRGGSRGRRFSWVGSCGRGYQGHRQFNVRYSKKTVLQETRKYSLLCSRTVLDSNELVDQAFVRELR